MRRVLLTILAAGLSVPLAACGRQPAPIGAQAPTTPPHAQPEPETAVDPNHDTRIYVVPADLEAKVRAGTLRSAVFAGGCFWCMETTFEGVPGVVAAISGFSGGAVPNPTYEDVGSGMTGHAEAVRAIYDPKVIDYPKLLELFWHNVDPTQSNGQFCDHGNQYRSAVFYGSEAEKAAAEAARDTLKLDAPIVTEIVPFKAFYAAENYHQDFFRKQPEHYHAYREGCGRDRRLQALWGVAAH